VKTISRHAAIRDGETERARMEVQHLRQVAHENAEMSEVQPYPFRASETSFSNIASPR